MSIQNSPHSEERYQPPELTGQLPSGFRDEIRRRDCVFQALQKEVAGKMGDCNPFADKMIASSLTRVLKKCLSDIILVSRENVTSSDMVDKLYPVVKIAGEFLRQDSLSFVSELSQREFLGDVLIATLQQVAGTTITPLKFICTTCPDYPFDDSLGGYVYKPGLGGGAGASARAFMRDVHPVIRILRSHKLPHHVVFAFADFELFDTDYQQRTRESSDVAQMRIDQSLSAARTEALRSFGINSADILTTVNATRMTELWPGLNLKIRDCPLDKYDNVIRGIIGQRKLFYDRFFQPRSADHDRAYARERRAGQDLASHLAVGELVASERSNGALASIITQSNNLLARLFNKGRSSPHIPVFIGHTRLFAVSDKRSSQ